MFHPAVSPRAIVRVAAGSFATAAPIATRSASRASGPRSTPIGGSRRARWTGIFSARAASTTTAADAYGIDRLFRSAGQAGVGSAATATVSPNEQARSEAAHIVSQSVATGSLIDTDRTYLTSLIVQQTGASAGDARQRVDELVQNLNDAKSRLEQAADSARKAGAETAIYTALSMLIGAFIASVSAAFAGRLRDEHP